MKERILPWAGTCAAVGAAAFLAVAGSHNGVRMGTVPAFALCIAVAFAVCWIVFVPAWLLRSERFYDLAGSATFLGAAAVALLAAGSDPRSWVIAALVAVWAVRLGVFLSGRIRRDGFDRRFTTIKRDFPLFLMTWTLQALWVSVSFGPGLAAMTSGTKAPPDTLLAVGAALWAAGFAIEVTADAQKRRFRDQEGNAGHFIRHGLWAWSQHPNYFGEILLWSGIALCALPALDGWQHATLASPVFVWLLLTRISGTRMLDATARRRWGDDPDYLEYTARTPRLIPVPPRMRSRGAATR